MIGMILTNKDSPALCGVYEKTITVDGKDLKAVRDLPEDAEEIII